MHCIFALIKQKKVHTEAVYKLLNKQRMIKLKTTLSITLACISFICLAQEKMSIERLYFTGGKNIGSFSFKTSSGEKDKNLQWKMGNALGASMGIKLKEKQTIKAGLLYYETGSGSSFLEEKIDWQFNYMQFNVSYLYRLLEKGNFNLRAGALLGYDHLLKAEQSIGTVRYDLKELKSIKSFDFSLEPLAEANFKLSEISSIGIEYRFKRGFNQLEEKDADESAYNIGHKLLINLSITLK
jgi:hypothetical protein